MTDFYSPIADEYYDPELHPTCQNFSQLSFAFIEKHLDYIQDSNAVLEIGSGRSVAAEVFWKHSLPIENILITDLSDRMLQHSRKWAAFGAKLSIADATSLPFVDESIDGIVACMADPYNVTSFWKSVQRICKRGSRALVTLPSHKWAMTYRSISGESDIDHARFELKDNTTVLVPSLIHPLHTQIEMIQLAGLEVEKFASLQTTDLPVTAKVSPKALPTSNQYSPLVWGFVLIKP